MYLDGLGVPPNYAEAAKWFRKAAEQGFASAQYGAGWMHINGMGVPEDYVQDLMWVSLSVAGLKGKEADRFFLRDFFVFLQDKSGSKILAKEFKKCNIP